MVTEGVFDAMRMGRRGVALFGKVASQQQIQKLVALGRSRRIIIMLDHDAHKDAMMLACSLQNLIDDVWVASLPVSRKDPDECTFREAWSIVAEPTNIDGRGQLLSRVVHKLKGKSDE